MRLRFSEVQSDGRPVSECGSVLVTVLWCLTILGVICIGTLHTSRLSLRAAKYHGDQTQAYYLAIAGVEKAKAVIHREILESQSRAVSYSDTLTDSPIDFEETPLGRGTYRVYHQAQDQLGGRVRFGLGTEDALLNLNSCSLDELKKLEEIDNNLASALVDWRDADAKPNPGGAEAEVYDKLPDPYTIRNAPFMSPLETLMVRDVDAVATLGEDANANRVVDPSERDGQLSFPPDNGDDQLDGGWFHQTSLYSAVRNLDPRGEDRVNITDADADALTAIDGITDEIAAAIVAARDNLSTPAHLLDVRAQSQTPNGANNSNQNNNPNNGGAPNGPGNNPNNNANSSGNNNGEKLIDSALLLQIAPYVTTQGGEWLPGRININAASRDVLLCLAGLNETLVDAVLDARQSNGPFQSVAALLEVEGFSEALVKQIYNRLTVRSDTYYFTSEGEVPSTGARRRISCVIRFDGIAFTTLSYREDS